MHVLGVPKHVKLSCLAGEKYCGYLEVNVDVIATEYNSHFQQKTTVGLSGLFFFKFRRATTSERECGCLQNVEAENFNGSYL